MASCERTSSARGATAALAMSLHILFGSLILAQHARAQPKPSPPPAARVTFTDITTASGLASFRHVSGGPDKTYIMETISGGVALVDYDRDGWLDVYLVNGGTLETLRGRRPPFKNRLYRNLRDGQFADVTDKAGVGGNSGWGMGVAVGDYDGDGWDDIYAANYGPNILYRNNGDGTFADVTKETRVDDPRMSTGAAFGDYDRDGDLDLFVANYVELDLDRLPEPSGANIDNVNNCRYRGVPVMCGPRGIKGAGDTLYRNNGDGTFSDVSVEAGVSDPKGYRGFQPVWCDFDNDGYLDLYVANDKNPNLLYLNNGDGKFTETGYVSGAGVDEQGMEQGSMGVALGDYDGDNLMDLYVTNFADEPNNLYRNAGRGLFTDLAYPSGHGWVTLPYVGWGAGFFDFDNDADLDVFVVNGHVFPLADKFDWKAGYKQRTLLFENDGQGKFAEIGALAGTPFRELRSGRGAACGDLDNDGDLDVIINNMDGAPSLLRNDGGNRNNWLQLRLTSHTKVSAINARIRLRSGARWQTGEVTSGGSYLSQNSFRAHFGLGGASQVDEIEIAWPSGRRTGLQKVKANQILDIEEPPAKKR